MSVISGISAAAAARVVGWWLGRRAALTTNAWDDVIAAGLRRGAWAIGLVVGLESTTHGFGLAPGWKETIDQIVLAVGSVYLAILCSRAIRRAVSDRALAAAEAGRPSEGPAWNLLGYAGGAALWVGGTLVTLDTLGIDITALVAGLGIGGLALGLAVQRVLGDAFASVAVVVDQPFTVGDFVEVGEFAGTVESIGLRTTRLRSLGGEQLVIANADMLGSRIRNYQKLDERRIAVQFGVVYATAPGRLEEIRTIAAAAVLATPRTRLDRVHLARLGDSALEFELIFWFLGRDFNEHMDARHDVLSRLFGELTRAGHTLAFPTRTIHVAELGPVPKIT